MVIAQICGHLGRWPYGFCSFFGGVQDCPPEFEIFLKCLLVFSKHSVATLGSHALPQKQSARLMQGLNLDQQTGDDRMA